jgi:hypothetical protein
MGNFASSLGMSTDTDSNDTTNNNIQIKRPSQKKLITAEESVKAFNFLTTTSREIDHSRRRRTVRAIETASRRKAIPAKNAQALRDEELSSILEDIARISADPSLTEVERIKLIRTAMPAPLSPEGKRKNQKKKKNSCCVCVCTHKNNPCRSTSCESCECVGPRVKSCTFCWNDTCYV